MRTICAIVLLWLPNALLAEGKPVSGRITSVGLFKNGLGIVALEISVPGSGTYYLDSVPLFVHGSYWVEAEVPVETALRTRDVESGSSALTGAGLQADLAGQKVAITLKNRPGQPIQGIVVMPPPIEEPNPEEAENFRRHNSMGGNWFGQSPEFLHLKTDKGQLLVSKSEIAFVETPAEERKRTVKKPILVFTVGGQEDKPAIIKLRYMGRGLAWAPNYRVDISDPKNLVIEQAATIKNTFTELRDVEVSLITGVPNVPFAYVTTPLAPRNTWTNFFAELRQKGEPDAPAMSQMGYFHSPGYQSAVGSTKAATVGGDRMDVHYHSIGKKTLAVGDAIALSVATQQTPYERVVEWIVCDSRRSDGRHQPRNDENHNAADEQPWDALRFKNPFPFPMTTAPAWVESGRRFVGQATIPWIAMGDQAFLRVNQALSIRATAMEEENADKSRKESVRINDSRYERHIVDGKLTIRNLRAESVSMVIRRRFSGDLVTAEGGPKRTLMEEGIFAVNRRNELLWQFPIAAGEEKTLTYQYTVLIHN